VRKRTIRKTRLVKKNIVSDLFNADEPMPEHDRVAVLTELHSAVFALSRGFGEAHHWDTLIIGLNIAVNVCAMAKNGHIGLNAVNEARNALISVRERAHDLGRYVFTGEELSAVNGGIHVYEQIIETVGRRQYVRACKMYTRDANAGKTRKILPGQETKRFKMAAAV
jgi:hypothetical protein